MALIISMMTYPITIITFVAFVPQLYVSQDALLLDGWDDEDSVTELPLPVCGCFLKSSDTIQSKLCPGRIRLEKGKTWSDGQRCPVFLRDFAGCIEAEKKLSQTLFRIQWNGTSLQQMTWRLPRNMAWGPSQSSNELKLETCSSSSKPPRTCRKIHGLRQYLSIIWCDIQRPRSNLLKIASPFACFREARCFLMRRGEVSVIWVCCLSNSSKISKGFETMEIRRIKLGSWSLGNWMTERLSRSFAMTWKDLTNEDMGWRSYIYTAAQVDLGLVVLHVLTSWNAISFVKCHQDRDWVAKNCNITQTIAMSSATTLRS